MTRAWGRLLSIRALHAAVCHELVEVISRVGVDVVSRRPNAVDANVVCLHLLLQRECRAWIHPGHVAVDEGHILDAYLVQTIYERIVCPGEGLEQRSKHMLSRGFLRQEVVQIRRHGVVLVGELGAEITAKALDEAWAPGAGQTHGREQPATPREARQRAERPAPSRIIAHVARLALGDACWVTEQQVLHALRVGQRVAAGNEAAERVAEEVEVLKANLAPPVFDRVHPEAGFQCQTLCNKTMRSYCSASSGVVPVKRGRELRPNPRRSNAYTEPRSVVCQHRCRSTIIVLSKRVNILCPKADACSETVYQDQRWPKM